MQIFAQCHNTHPFHLSNTHSKTTTITTQQTHNRKQHNHKIIKYTTCNTINTNTSTLDAYKKHQINSQQDTLKTKHKQTRMTHFKLTQTQ